jgi:hypothetical protein
MMRNRTVQQAESAIAQIKSGIFAASAGVALLSSLEEDAVMEGVGEGDLSGVREALDRASREVRQLKKAEAALHERVRRLLPPDGPAPRVGT